MLEKAAKGVGNLSGVTMLNYNEEARHTSKNTNWNAHTENVFKDYRQVSNIRRTLVDD